MQQTANIISQKFFLYARKSTDVEDKQIRSIPDQILELREFAKREGLNILEELIEKQSAKIPGRPVFNSMIERIENNEASGILTWHPDRLARNSIDGGKIIYLVDRGKIKSLKFPQFWFDPTPQGKFMLTIRRKIIVIDKKRAHFVKEAFEIFATGNYKILDIKNFLAKNGILSRYHNPWKTEKVTKQLLTNPFYYGHFKFLGELHEGVHEPLITKKLWDKVQEIVGAK